MRIDGSGATSRSWKKILTDLNQGRRCLLREFVDIERPRRGTGSGADRHTGALLLGVGAVIRRYFVVGNSEKEKKIGKFSPYDCPDQMGMLKSTRWKKRDGMCEIEESWRTETTRIPQWTLRSARIPAILSSRWLLHSSPTARSFRPFGRDWRKTRRSCGRDLPGKSRQSGGPTSPAAAHATPPVRPWRSGRRIRCEFSVGKTIWKRKTKGKKNSEKVCQQKRSARKKREAQGNRQKCSLEFSIQQLIQWRSKTRWIRLGQAEISFGPRKKKTKS